MDSLIKSKHPKNFTAVDNDFIRDERLSWKAKGIIIYVMSLPDDWRLYITELSKHAKDGRDSTYRGINELIEFGYCKRTELHDERGKFAGVEYLISDKVEFLPLTENPHTENPHTENPYPGNQPLINTNKQKTDNNKKQDIYNNINNKNNNLDKDKEKIERERLVERENKEKEQYTGELFESEKTEKKPRKKPDTNENLCLFVNSKFYDYDTFAAQFTGPEYQEIDIAYYYGVVMDWSSSKGVKRKDWIAQTRNIMRKDKDANKLHLLPKNVGYGDAVLSPEAIKYLEMGRL